MDRRASVFPLFSSRSSFCKLVLALLRLQAELSADHVHVGAAGIAVRDVGHQPLARSVDVRLRDPASSR